MTTGKLRGGTRGDEQSLGPSEREHLSAADATASSMGSSPNARTSSENRTPPSVFFGEVRTQPTWANSVPIRADPPSPQASASTAASRDG